MINSFPVSNYEHVGESFEMTDLEKNTLTAIASITLSQLGPAELESLKTRGFILFKNFVDHLMIDTAAENIKKFVASTHFTENTQNEHGQYQGSVEDGKPKRGTMTVPLGEYTGAFVGGLPEGGAGVMKTYGSTIQAPFLQGLPHGEGKAHIINYNTIRSKLKNSHFDPNELAGLPQHNTYEGMFEMGKYQGFGKYKWMNGSCYEGQWKNGKMDGQGTFKSNNGDIYTGEWKNGKMNGQGTFKSNNGDIYTGEWKNGIRDGQGTTEYGYRDCYTGEYRNGIRDGQGTYEWNDGNIYTGQWKNGKIDGQGTFKSNNGDIYRGEWKNGIRDGQGTFILNNGDIYIGQWKNGNKHGQGKLTLANGEINEGIFKNDQFDDTSECIIL